MNYDHFALSDAQLAGGLPPRLRAQLQEPTPTLELQVSLDELCSKGPYSQQTMTVGDDTQVVLAVTPDDGHTIVVFSENDPDLPSTSLSVVGDLPREQSLYAVVRDVLTTFDIGRDEVLWRAPATRRSSDLTL